MTSERDAISITMDQEEEEEEEEEVGEKTIKSHTATLLLPQNKH